MFKDVLSNMDLSMAPVVALVGFFLTFVGIGLWLMFGHNTPHFERMNALPLQDGTAASDDGATHHAVTTHHGMTTPHAGDTAFSGGQR